MSEIIDLTGKRFGRLEVISFDYDYYNSHKGHHRVKFICKCDCNNIVSVDSYSLRKGKTRSCGCLAIEKTVERTKKHGKYKSRIYKIWESMKQRCSLNRKTINKNYAGRGIRVCKEWDNFEEFYKWAIENGYSDDLSIERIDVNGDYCPGNCTWITIKEQAKNRRNSLKVNYNGENILVQDLADRVGLSRETVKARFRCGWDVNDIIKEKVEPLKITFNGETKTASQWSKETGINESTIRGRLRNNWPVDKALTTTPKSRSHHKTESE